MFNISKWFSNAKLDTNYKPPTIPAKALELIEYMDSKLVDLHAGLTHTANAGLQVNICVISLNFSQRPTSALCNYIDQQLLTNSMYIPRSIAFYIDHDGNWIFAYGTYSEIESLDVTKSLFIEMMKLTNKAREYSEATNG